MTTKKQEKIEMYARIEKHGLQLLALFPDCKEKDPIKLCKQLRVYEGKITRINEILCNGKWVNARFYNPLTETEINDLENQRINMWRAVSKKMGSSVFGPCEHLNCDPRGYALKIVVPRETEIHMDMGGYGILAPDLTEN